MTETACIICHCSGKSRVKVPADSGSGKSLLPGSQTLAFHPLDRKSRGAPGVSIPVPFMRAEPA